MNRSLPAVVLAVGLAVAPLATAGVARADDAASAANRTEASNHFRKGVTFFKDNDFRDALFEFKRAYQLAPSSQVLFNVARCHAQLRENAKALTAFERYLATAAPDELDAERKQAISSEVQRLEQHVARIDLRVALDGAEIKIDSEALPAGTTGIVVIDTGPHTVVASKDGYAPATKSFEVAAGERIVVELDPKPVAQVAALAPPSSVEPSAPPAASSRNTAAWITGIGTVVLAAGAATCGGLALSAHSDLGTANLAFPGDASEVTRDHDRMRSFSLAADILGVAAVAAGVTTIVLVATHGSNKEATGVALGVGPLGAVARGTF